MPRTAEELAQQLRTELEATAVSVDAAFPTNTAVSINKDGEPVLKRPAANKPPATAMELEAALQTFLPECSLLDIVWLTNASTRFTHHSDSAHKKTHALLCQEYLLQTDTVIYRIRPRDEKHPALLPVGAKAQFRIQKDKMLLQVEDLDQKERKYSVVSNNPAQGQTIFRNRIVEIKLADSDREPVRNCLMKQDLSGHAKDRFEIRRSHRFCGAPREPAQVLSRNSACATASASMSDRLLSRLVPHPRRLHFQPTIFPSQARGSSSA